MKDQYLPSGPTRLSAHPFCVVKSVGRRKKDGTKPVVWCVRATTSAATLWATFTREADAVKHCKILCSEE